ncbi:hypothetical protein RHSIM_Rhsim09G0204000 [Rhododendron simsii]|uniref:Uncharacterized protein n=1 Tax=Rhododendron simsii TaxID=118357 RepID=A0A834GHB5_RHOSS|nr:hypothetical protein RHSIM_Rhsim09G0204000 [Rhododendron simsii]
MNNNTSEIASTIRGFCQDIHSPLIHVKDLRKHGVTLYFLIDKDRKPVHDVPAVYFVQPTQPNVHLIAAAASHSLYDSFQLNFSSSISVLHVIVGMLQKRRGDRLLPFPGLLAFGFHLVNASEYCLVLCFLDKICEKSNTLTSDATGVCFPRLWVKLRRISILKERRALLDSMDFFRCGH